MKKVLISLITVVTSSTVALLFLFQPAAHRIDPQELSEIILSADRLVIKQVSLESEEIIYESIEKSDFVSLNESILPNPVRYSIMYGSDGNPVISLFRNGELVEEIKCFGDAIRCSFWEGEVELIEGEKLLTWLDQRGMAEIYEREAEQRVIAGNTINAYTTFKAFMPTCLKEIWQDDLVEENINAYRTKLIESVPNKNERIMALLSWYGEESRDWNEPYAFLKVPEQLLGDYSTDEIIDSLNLSQNLTRRQKEGAARFFCCVNSASQENSVLIPKILRVKLWEHVKSTEFDFKRKLAEKVLQP